MYVYLLQSDLSPSIKYIGKTIDLKQRLRQHNAGKSKHTSKYAPWKLKVSVWFEDTSKAEAFEVYLKRGSGHVFAKKHFW